MEDFKKDIDPSKITDVGELREVVLLLLNVIEEQSVLLKSQKEEIQQLRDEINRLKGEKGKPDFKPKKEPDAALGTNDVDGDKDKRGNHKTGADKDRVQVDRIVELIDTGLELPADAVIKSWEERTVQDIVLRRDTVLYRIAVWYSPSEHQTYKSVFPLSGQGSFGPQIRGLLHLLHYECDVTQGRLESFCESLGLSVSGGSIDNILKSHAEEAVAERKGILSAGIANSGYVQADSTGGKEKGVSLYTQIFCSPLFTAYFSNPTKSRQQVLQSLCGLTEAKDLPVIMNADTLRLLGQFKVPKTYQEALACFWDMGECTSLGELQTWIKEELPELACQKNTFTRALDAFALAHYLQRDDFPTLSALMSDDAPEYKLISPLHSLCWIHDARDYKKLAPIMDIYRQQLQSLMDDYWKFYKSLLEYKGADAATRTLTKPGIEAEFERVFTRITGYGALDKLIARTFSKKTEMLHVLNRPDLPLHNNAAELAARRKVRKRDVSLHTMSAEGTRVQDAYLSIIETAKKLGISAYEYITDFVAHNKKMTPLAKIIESKKLQEALEF